MARSKKELNAQSSNHETEEEEVLDETFLKLRAPRKPTIGTAVPNNLAFSDNAVGPGTVGGMRTYYT